MKNKLISAILILSLAKSSTCDSEICTKCRCEDEVAFTLNCASKHVEIPNEWPQTNKTLIVSFGGNVIKTLKRLPPSDNLTEVVFSYCGINTLAPGLFEQVRNIEFIDLSHNDIDAAQLSQEVFKGPYEKQVNQPIPIKHLNLAYNKIHTLPSGLFNHMIETLETLNLEGNDLRVLDIPTQHALSSALNLKRLNLANNDLTDLVNDAIDKLELVELNLASNDLDLVPWELKYMKNTLEILNLDDNPIIELNNKSFVDLENIIELRLSYLSPIDTIGSNTFSPMTKLRYLNMSGNRNMKEINPKAFEGNIHLQELYLNDNALVELDFDLLDWKQLRTFEAKGNKLRCECDLFNITTSLDEKIRENRDGPICYDIRYRRSRQIYDLQSDICSEWEEPKSVYHRSVLKNALLSLGIIMFIVLLAMVAILYSRYKKNLRMNSLTSNVLYNPISTAPIN